MNVTKWRIFQGSIFKQLAFLFTSDKPTERVLLISEGGTLSLINLPHETNLVQHEKKRMCFSDIQQLKISVQGTDTFVLPVNERSKYPLDPYKRMTAKEKEDQASLKTLAQDKYIAAQSNVSQGKTDTGNMRMAKTVLWALTIVACMCILIMLVTRG